MFLTAKEAAEFLRMPVSQIYQLTHQSRIKYYKPGGKNLLFLKKDLLDYVLSKEHSLEGA